MNFVLKSNLNFIWALLVLDIVLLYIAITGQNIQTSILSVCTINLIAILFYRPGIPLVILFAMLYQWVQASIKVWFANYEGIPLNEVFSLYGGEEHIEDAFYLSSFGLIFLSLGLFIAIKNIDTQSFYESLTKQLGEYHPKKILVGYLLITFILSLASRFSNVVPGLNTILIALAKLKWGFFLIYFLTAIQKRNSLKLFFLIISFEVVLSLSSYFSEFKYFIIYLLIGFISFTNVLNIKRLILLTPIVFFLFQFGVLWTAIKVDYRSFLSDNTTTMDFYESKIAAISTFYEMVLEVDETTFDDAILYMVDRVSFIEFFSHALGQVPELVPFENGKITLEAVSFYFMPRLLFPDKPEINDSLHTMKYTGLYFQWEKSSHSIGFLTDFYVDFGPYLMFVPIFFLGLLIGLLYKYFLLNSKNAFWGLIFTGPFFLLTSFFGFNLIKVFGNFFIYVVVVFIFRRFLVKIIDPYLKKQEL